jgi:hypothetical protein
MKINMENSPTNLKAVLKIEYPTNYLKKLNKTISILFVVQTFWTSKLDR